MPESRLHKLGIAAAAVLLLVLGGGAMALFVWRSARPDGFDVKAVQLCRVGYQRASTPAESALVDSYIPVTGRVQATVAVSCATLRAAGTLH